MSVAAESAVSTLGNPHPCRRAKVQTCKRKAIGAANLPDAVIEMHRYGLSRVAACRTSCATWSDKAGQATLNRHRLPIRQCVETAMRGDGWKTSSWWR